MFRIQSGEEGGVTATDMANALRFRQWKTPRQSGERARLKIVHGPDSGCLFVLTGDAVTLGRGDENDVVFADLKASRKHAELKKLANGRWQLRDLGSQNGVVWNGKVTRSADLKSGDVITVGETAFEFFPEDSATQLLQSNARPVNSELIHGRLPASSVPAPAPLSSVRALPNFPAPTPYLPHSSAPDMSGLQGIAGMGASTGSSGSSAEKRKKILIGVIVVLGVWMFMDDSSSKKPVAKGKTTEKKETKNPMRDLAQYLPPRTAASGAADTFYKEGFREFRERNYLRARVQFETALQINPAHADARNLLKQCDAAIEKEVKAHLDLGRRDLDAGKLRSARSHYEAVLRLLIRDQSNPDYAEAKDQLQRVVDQLKGALES